MKSLGRGIQLLSVAVLAGGGGFLCAVQTQRASTDELAEGLDQVPQMRMNDVAYAFAPTAQVRAMLQAEPPQPARWAHTERGVKLLRKLRLAVVAESPRERALLIDQAKTLCESCNDESLEKMIRQYAQDRLVAPGNDVECPDCTRKRRPL